MLPTAAASMAMLPKAGGGLRPSASTRSQGASSFGGRSESHAGIRGERAEQQRLQDLEREQHGRRHRRLRRADGAEQERRGQQDADGAQRDEQRPEPNHAAGIAKIAFSRTMRATPGRVSS